MRRRAAQGLFLLTATLLRPPCPAADEPHAAPAPEPAPAAPTRAPARASVPAPAAPTRAPASSSVPAPAPPPSAAELARAGRLFASECAVCHGPMGEGGKGPPLAVPKLARARDEESLLRVIRGGVEGTEMPSARLGGDDVRLVAAVVQRLGRRPPEKVPGDPGRGAALFAGKGGCPACHSLRGRGGALGADLGDIGLRRGASYLRDALVRPEADVPKSYSQYRNDISLSQNFLQVRVVTRSGREITGVRLNEDTFSLQLRDATNRIHSFWKSELRQLHKDWGKSPMPSYAEALSPQELDDLVAFLVSLRSTDP